MTRLQLFLLLLALLALSVSRPLAAQESVPLDTPEEIILKATVRMKVTYAVGWQYSGNVWEKGTVEPAEVGQPGTSDLNNGPRAVCLGKETIDGGEYYVFFCLRSFVDPFYPSPVIQGADFELYGSDGNKLVPPKEVDLSPEASDKLSVNWLSGAIRYGRIELIGYKDLGGGKLEVVSKHPVTVFHDPGEVKVINGEWFRHPKEDFNGGTYPVPNVEFGVAEHFSMQEEAKEGRVAGLRFYEEHDAVLIYVPKAAYLHGEQPEPLHHLGLRNPTLAADLALRRPDQLFGFPYVLMGQETLEQIRAYQPPDYAGNGFGKAFNLLGLAMDPKTFAILKSVDSFLDTALPDPSKMDSWNELRLGYATLTGDQLGQMGVKLYNEMLAPALSQKDPWWKRLWLIK